MDQYMHIVAFLLLGIGGFGFSTTWLYKITKAKEYFNPEVLFVIFLMCSSVFSIVYALKGVL